MGEGEPKYLDSIFYVSLDTVPSIITDKLHKTDIYVTMKNKSNYMTDEYDRESKAFADSIKQEFPNDCLVLTLNENTGYALFYNSMIYNYLYLELIYLIMLLKNLLFHHH